MTNKISSKKSSPSQRVDARPKAPVPALPKWRLLIYLGMAVVIFFVIFVKLGGVFPEHYASVAGGRDADPNANGFFYFIPAGVFTCFILALLALILEPVFIGIAQHKSKLAIAEDLAISVVTTAVSVAFDVALDAATSSSSGDSASGDFKGGGGSFGGGGASGSF